MARSQLDPGQIVKDGYDESSQAHRVKSIAGGLVTDPYDFISLTYVPSGNGAGEIQTVTFKLGGSGGTTVAVLTLTYDSSNKLSTVTKS